MLREVWFVDEGVNFWERYRLKRGFFIAIEKGNR